MRLISDERRPGRSGDEDSNLVPSESAPAGRRTNDCLIAPNHHHLTVIRTTRYDHHDKSSAASLANERRSSSSGGSNSSPDLLALRGHHSSRRSGHQRPRLRPPPARSMASLFAFAALAAHLLLISRASALQQETTNLPTVIVRGFLNYRTTVDGTVLLFTPDAGAGQPTASSPQPASTQMAPSRQIVTLQTQPVVATTNLLDQLELGASSRLTSSPLDQIRPTQTVGQPLASTFLASNNQYQNDQPADEWRPIQATPPLQPLQTSTAPPKAFRRPDSGADLTTELPSSSTKEPSVQADDVHSTSTEATSNQPPPVTTPTNRPQHGRPRRPSLGFNGQGARNRTAAPSPVTATSPLPSGQPANGNGLRRPSLSGAGQSRFQHSTTSTTPEPEGAPPAPLAPASSFQTRLANANQRLKNRFKQRNQQAMANLTANSNQGTSGAGSLAALVPVTEGGSNRLLDVATIEQPTMIESAASSPSRGEASSAPVVGSDDVLASSSSSREAAADLAESVASSSAAPEQSTQSSNSESDVVLEAISAEQQAGTRALSRAGEQRPQRVGDSGEPKLLVGALQQGQLSSSPLSLEALFQSDQPETTSSSEHQASHTAKHADQQPGSHATSPRKKFTNHNDKLNGWLDQHHNRFVPRPAIGNKDSDGQLSQQLVASLAQHQPPAPPPHKLAPSFSSSLAAAEQQMSSAIKPTPTDSAVASTKLLPSDELAQSANATESLVDAEGGQNGTSPALQLQTITRTFSTIQTTSKTRLIPLQVKSSTAIYTLTENYVITKMLTAYQTMPAGGEFILTEPLSTRAPYDLFNEQTSSNELKEQPIVAPPPAAVGASPAVSSGTEEQPISLDQSQPVKSGNDWLHDFSTLNDNNNNNGNEKAIQQNLLANSFLEQQARDANSLAAFGLGPNPNEPLDQLASSLDPTLLLADGTINIPDLNNPIVLAAAIQNPQLAAVILAAQQLQLKQRQQKLNGQQPNQNLAANGNNIQANQLQPQPSYSTSFSTTIKPTTYTVRDTMFTTRLVSFKDGRTVRTRTVSEPGSVVEQVLTTMATEVTPVTITIRPTAPALVGPLATAASAALPSGASPSSQTTINNALFAAQLANILARRQQQLQPSLAPTPQLGPSSGAAATPQQLLAFQQLLNSQRQQQQQQLNGNANNPPKQFQPNFQQLLQSLQQQQPSAASSPSQTNQAQAQATNSNNGKQQQQQQQQQPQASEQQPVPSNVPTPPLGPITTTLTSLQVRTYTVHNAFKTIYRTITSTQLITSTILPGARSSLVG